MKLVRIAHRVSDIAYGQTGQLQKLRGFYHAVVHDELFGRLSHRFFEDPSEIAPIETAEFCNALNGDIVLKILLDIAEGFLDIKVSQTSFRRYLHGGRGAGKIIHEQIEVADQMEGGFVSVFCHIDHLLLHALAQIFGLGVIDRIVRAQACDLHNLFCTQSVEFDPGVFPGKHLIRHIGSDLPRKEHESLSAFYMISMCLTLGIVCHQFSSAGDHIVEEKMIAGCRSEGVGGFALFLSELVQSEVYKIFIWKHRKQNITHIKKTS